MSDNMSVECIFYLAPYITDLNKLHLTGLAKSVLGDVDIVYLLFYSGSIQDTYFLIICINKTMDSHMNIFSGEIIESNGAITLRKKNM